MAYETTNIIELSLDQLEVHPDNPERVIRGAVETEDEKEERLAFTAGLAGIKKLPKHKALLVSKEKNKHGKHWIYQGRRRFEGSLKLVRNKRLPENYKLPCAQLLTPYEECKFEVLYGDNDNAKPFSKEVFKSILIKEYGLDYLLEDPKIGGVAALQEEGNIKKIAKDFYWKPYDTLRKYIYEIRRDNASSKKYKLPDNEELIEKLNSNLESYLTRLKHAKDIEAEKQEKISEISQKYSTKINSALTDARSFAKGFPKGGPEAYARAIMNSKQDIFKWVKRSRVVREFLDELEKHK